PRILRAAMRLAVKYCFTPSSYMSRAASAAITTRSPPKRSALTASGAAPAPRGASPSRRPPGARPGVRRRAASARPAGRSPAAAPGDPRPPRARARGEPPEDAGPPARALLVGQRRGAGPPPRVAERVGPARPLVPGDPQRARGVEPIEIGRQPLPPLTPPPGS